eukprot:2206284-Pleurochrysis_carterae.AAC.2
MIYIEGRHIYCCHAPITHNALLTDSHASHSIITVIIVHTCRMGNKFQALRLTRFKYAMQSLGATLSCHMPTLQQVCELYSPSSIEGSDRA